MNVSIEDMGGLSPLRGDCISHAIFTTMNVCFDTFGWKAYLVSAVVRATEHDHCSKCYRNRMTILQESNLLYKYVSTHVVKQKHALYVHVTMCRAPVLCIAFLL